MKTKATMIAATVAGMFAAGLPVASVAFAGGKVHCDGGNSCKGKSGCKSAANSCKGQNECKGKGWAMMSEAKCKKAGGTVAPAEDAKK